MAYSEGKNLKYDCHTCGKSYIATDIEYRTVYYHGNINDTADDADSICNIPYRYSVPADLGNHYNGLYRNIIQVVCSD